MSKSEPAISQSRKVRAHPRAACPRATRLTRAAAAAARLGAQIKEGQYVWVKDSAIAGTDLFTKGHVLGIDGNKVTVETSNDVKSQELILPAAECFHPHPGDDVPDHTQLMFLSQPTLLENTRRRFAKDKIYTLVGDILIAVNPFKWIEGIYGTDVRPRPRPTPSAKAATPAARATRRGGTRVPPSPPSPSR